MTLFFYFPPPRVNTLGKTKMQVLKEIDYIGGILSIGGMILFLAGLQWGGYQVTEPFPKCTTQRTNAILVRMDFSTRHRAPYLGCAFARVILPVGDVRCTTSHVPRAN